MHTELFKSVQLYACTYLCTRSMQNYSVHLFQLSYARALKVPAPQRYLLFVTLYDTLRVSILESSSILYTLTRSLFHLDLLSHVTSTTSTYGSHLTFHPKKALLSAGFCICLGILWVGCAVLGGYTEVFSPWVGEVVGAVRRTQVF